MELDTAVIRHEVLDTRDIVGTHGKVFLVWERDQEGLDYTYVEIDDPFLEIHEEIEVDPAEALDRFHHIMVTTGELATSHGLTA